MSGIWYYKVMGEDVGPVTPDDLKQKAQTGVIRSDTLVRKGKEGNWVNADQVKGLLPDQPAPAFSPPPLSAKFADYEPEDSSYGAESTSPATAVASAPARTAKSKPVVRSAYGSDAPYKAVCVDSKFNEFVTPNLVVFLYWIARIFAVLGWCAAVAYATVMALVSFGDAEGLLDILLISVGWLITTALATGVIFWMLLLVRISLESIMVLYRMADHLGRMDRNLADESL